ncbi:MAG: TonB-dependent receptor [Proteobacteria bacterium]|nr:TonB-dependent receptor [Pseudomonadota bacterium]
MTWHLMLLFASFGQQETSENNTETLSPLQVTASKTATSSNDTSSAISVVTRDEIKQKQNTLLPDLLRGEVGVYIQQTTPGQGIPIIRGMKGSQNVHLVDGMRLNTAFFRNSPSQYLALVDPFLTEQIEVLRGPSSVLYGGDALGGVVNIISHSPEFYSDEFQTSGQLFTSWDSADEKWISHFDTDLGNEKIATSIGITYQDIGQRTTGSGEQIPFTAYTSRAFNNKWVINTDQASSWMFDLQYVHQPATPRVDDLVAGFGQSNPDSELFLFQPNARLFSHLRYQTHQQTSWYDQANYSIAWQKITDNRRRRSFGSTDTDTEQNSSELFSLQADFNKSFSNQTLLVFGIDSYKDTIFSARQRTTETGEVLIRESRFPNESTMQHIGLFADYHFFKNDHDFTVGGRYSDYNIDLNSENIANDKLNLTDLTWHVSWLYRLNKMDRIFANIGRGFRPPNIFDLGQVGERPGDRFNVINPALTPESVLSVDLGIKHAGNGWKGELVVFVADYQDVIASVETGELTDEGLSIVQSQNINKVRLYGLESDIDYFFKNGSQLFANLTYTWGEEQAANEQKEPADRIPPAFGVIGYQQDFATNWSGKTQVRYASTQNRLSARDLRDARINPYGTGGFTSYDAFVTWHSNFGYQLRLGVENIFDKKYREHASGLDAAGRNYHISFSYEF